MLKGVIRTPFASIHRASVGFLLLPVLLWRDTKSCRVAERFVGLNDRFESGLGKERVCCLNMLLRALLVHAWLPR